MKNSKRSLVASGLSLAVSAALLLGTTFAWFTDSVTSTGNRIQAGNLQVDLLMDKAGDGNYVSIADSDKGDIFSAAQGGNGYNWEPGMTQIVYLAVKNTGSLALNYNFILDVTDGNPGLADALDYAVLNGTTADDLKDAKTWEDIVTISTADVPTSGYVGDVVDGQTTFTPGRILEAEEMATFAMAVHMDEEAGNEYQNGSITIDVNLVAKQAMSETDGFGSNQYDKDAVYQQANVEYDESKTARENGIALQQAIANAEEGTVIYVESGTYDLPRDTASVEGQPGWYFAIDTDNLTIVGEEGTVLTSTEYSANGAWASQNLVTIFGDNVTLENLTIKSKMDTNKAIEVRGKNSAIRNVQVLCNDITTHEDYLDDKGIEENSETDYWDFYNSDFAGSLYYAGDIGNATLENFYIDKAWVSTTDVTTGAVSMTDVTIGYAGSGYAGTSLPISANASTVLQNGSELTVTIDNQFGDLQGLVDRLPQGATISLAAGSYALNSFSLGAKEIVIAGTEGVTLAPQQNVSSDFGAIVIQGANGGKLTVRDVTIAGAASNDGSRGICFSGQGNTDAELVVENCDISNVNTGIYLGGVANATIKDCTITNCTAGIGGSENITGTLKVDTCTFSGNGENIGWAGSGDLVIANSPTCESFNDYTDGKNGESVSVTEGTYPNE